MSTQILQGPVWWLRLMGIVSPPLPPPSSNWQCCRLANQMNVRFMSFVFNTMCIVVPEIAYTVLRAGNILAVTQVLYPIVTAIGCTFQLVMLAIHRDDIRQLLTDMQRIVNAPSTSGNETTDYFRRTEATVTWYCRVYERLLVVTYLLYITMPVVMQQFETTRTPRPNDCGLFHDMYFIDVSQTPLRELCHIIMCFFLAFLLVLYISIDLFFCGLCLYLVAMYQVLQHRLRYIAAQRCRPPIASCQTRRNLFECIELHRTIMRFTATINNIFCHIIFVQFGYSLLAICCIIFEASMTSFSSMFKVGASTVSYLAELFIFCWFGALVLTEIDNLQLTVYATQWFEYDVAEQRMIQMFLMRAQKRCGLGAYNYFYCDLETFFQIMTNVYSILAFLQNMI